VSGIYSTRLWVQGVRPAVLARDGWRCQVLANGRKCNRLANEAGHRRALVDGGEPYQMSNLEAQCRHHNAVDGGRIAMRRATLGRTSRRW
jgi:hypothetical protein